jgi:hypothetical protein
LKEIPLPHQQQQHITVGMKTSLEKMYKEREKKIIIQKKKTICKSRIVCDSFREFGEK